MNFLNKKYTSLHGSSPYQSSNSKSFLPSSSTIRDSFSLSSNECESHPNEMVRHMCLECVELLCSQCIAEHLQMHREANIIPKIMSMRQLRNDMDSKIQQIIAFMNSQNPNLPDLEGLRKIVMNKIQNMKRDLMKSIDDWFGIMKNNLLSSLGFEEVHKAKLETEKLKDQVAQLQQALIGADQPAAVKKIYQIDAQKLRQNYNLMTAKYKELQQRTDFQISVNWKEITKTIQSNISIKSKTDPTLQNKLKFEPKSRRTDSNLSVQLESDDYKEGA